MKPVPKSVCIITQSHLCRNPRVLKEALLLAEHGYIVTIINTVYSRELNEQDKSLVRPYNIRLISFSLQYGVMAAIARLVSKAGRALVKNFGIQTPLALGYFAWQYTRRALKQNTDLYIAHQELGLYCGVELLKKGKNVAFDFEDWHSEDLLPAAKVYRPVKLLRKLEWFALTHGTYCTTTSNVLAARLTAAYNSPVPVCIYNTFSIKGGAIAKIKKPANPLRLFWFSQTIGPGRGLEQFFMLINKAERVVEIHLLGHISDDYRNKLKQLLSPQHRLYFYPLINPIQLPQFIAEFDIGLALELDKPQNRSLTITNKLFQYLLAGLPVIATNTLGQQEIIKKYGGGILIDFEDVGQAMEKLNHLLNDTAYFHTLQKQTRHMAEQISWDTEKHKLLNLIIANIP